MAEKYSKEYCDGIHDTINQNMLKMTEDLGYIKGKVDTLVDSHKDMQQNNSDWWSRIGCFIACAIAYFKGV